MTFRNDLNSLRAIAVIAVVLFHFNAPVLSGGFAGVDVFFVISGYLMTSIIVTAYQSERFSLLGFYHSRALRIIPALAVLCIFLMIYGWFMLIPVEYRDLGKNAFNSLLFTSNFTYWRNSGYFDPGSQYNALLHTWSLSVEWQFYVIYPIIVVLALRFLSIKTFKWFLVFAAISSFALSVVASAKWPTPSYFLLPTRAWEMLAGGIVFLFPIALSKYKQHSLFYVGLSMIAASYLLAGKETLWPSYFTLLPVIGTALVIAANIQNNWFSNNRLFQNLGLYSYSIYLWHWPIAVLLKEHVSTTWYIPVGIVLSVLLGFMSYTLVESRFRKHQDLKWTRQLFSKPTFIFSIALVLCFVVWDQRGITTDIRVVSTSAQSQFLNRYASHDYREKIYLSYSHECNFFDYKSTPNKVRTSLASYCTDFSDRKVNVLLWGDSHAQAISYGLRHIPSDLNLLQIATSSCRPSLNAAANSALKGTKFAACKASNQFALNFIKRYQPEVVVLAQANFHEQSDFTQLAKAIKALGVQEVVLVGPTPQWRPSLPRILAKGEYFDRSTVHIPYETLASDIEATNLALSVRYQTDKELHYLSLIDSLCDKQTGCLAKIDTENTPIVWDYGHLSLKGSQYVSSELLLPFISSNTGK
ncbi:acyltransferase family protein [Vibrio paucivorans]